MSLTKCPYCCTTFSDMYGHCPVCNPQPQGGDEPCSPPTTALAIPSTADAKSVKDASNAAPESNPPAAANARSQFTGRIISIGDDEKGQPRVLINSTREQLKGLVIPSFSEDVEIELRELRGKEGA